jgi:hypothetical protein
VVTLVQVFQLPLNHAPDRCGQLRPQIRQSVGQHPAAVPLGKHAALAQVAQQIDQEQRVPFRPGVYQLREIRRKGMPRER